MSEILKDIPVVMPIEYVSDKIHFSDDHILRNTISRFAEHADLIVSLPDTLPHRYLGRQLYRKVPAIKDRILMGSENSWNRLLQIMDRSNKEHVLVIPQNACGMPVASLDLMARLVDDPKVDLAYSDQFAGLLPLLMSKSFVHRLSVNRGDHTSEPSSLRTLARPSSPLDPMTLIPRKLLRSKWLKSNYNGTSLTEIQAVCENEDRIQKIRLFEKDAEHAPIPYMPQSRRDKALAAYLLQNVPRLESLFRDLDQVPVSESSALSKLLKEFSDTFAVSYPTYQLQGQPEIPEEIRGLTSNPKSVGHCYLIGINMTKFLKTYAGLRNDSRVLDIGCGWGALALGLVNVIDEPGSYLGLDIQKKAIDWAQNNLAPLNPNFSFRHIDVINSAYHPDGAIRAEEAYLPVESDSIDLVFLSSVFTHMRRESIERYLTEIQRVLRQGGIAAFSYFNSSFFGDNEDYRVGYADNPDRTTLFSAREMRRLLSASGLTEARPQVNFNARLHSPKPFFQTFMFAIKQ